MAPPLTLGQRYGRWVVIGRGERLGMRLCRCDCGTTKEVFLSNLINGVTKSCGCLRRERSRALRLAGPARKSRKPQPPRDIAGQRFGSLVAIERVGTHKRLSLWLCRCDCGGARTLTASALRRQANLACEPCVRQRAEAACHARLVQWVEQNRHRKFGMLTPLAPAERSGYVLCQCDCGKQAIVSRKRMELGQTRSCGCLAPNRKKLDLTGQRFGRLVAVEPAGKSSHGASLWRVRCDCGQSRVVTLASLRSGNTRSCGCRGKRQKKI